MSTYIQPAINFINTNLNPQTNINTLKNSNALFSERARAFTIIAGVTAASAIAAPILAALAVALSGPVGAALLAVLSTAAPIVLTVAGTAFVIGGIVYLGSLGVEKAIAAFTSRQDKI